ncbi:NAD-dependent epimerase/dehydratase family protein [Salinibacterium sp. G-O1]|uniref:NAD-dependent epimerase/dehydratase family protein n=1 Tax=Salinibacterium sp. G-O1 TaxID=3046208 RepID=UPI0024B8CF50|nr:NAD-dependent epimerase/dehydratase family protein [Salinibacterium sp. G-O1]MDJ0336514.1 NAD-dependent epimerase/dehydratase family protein [Salinibacterium sp. G-O1]
MTVAWVIGASGLLGSALTATIARHPNWELLPSAPLPWDDPSALPISSAAIMRELLNAASIADDDWAIIWAGGAGVTSTPQTDLDRELGQLRAIFDAAGKVIESVSSTATPPRGSIFYSSSAGGIYGGSLAPPFSEDTTPAPISPYGRFKLDAEAAVAAFASAHALSSLAGRIANLYGPGQKLGKMQGLISHLAKAQYSPAPASIFVSLDTVRDYIYVDDCAELILDSLDYLRSLTGPIQQMKILASGQAVTIGELLGHFHALAKAKPHVMLGQSAAASLQGLDLRLHSTVWTHLDSRTLTPLPVGIDRTMRAVLMELVS